jgi:hypothetical protein
MICWFSFSTILPKKLWNSQTLIFGLTQASKGDMFALSFRVFRPIFAHVYIMVDLDSKGAVLDIRLGFRIQRVVQGRFWFCSGIRVEISNRLTSNQLVDLLEIMNRWSARELAGGRGACGFEEKGNILLLVPWASAFGSPAVSSIKQDARFFNGLD